MGIFQRHFPLGLGTSHLPVHGPDDLAGIETSVELVMRALENGIDYIDTAYNYSGGMAPTVLKEAFRQTKRPFTLTAKVQYNVDPTADAARRRVELYLKMLDLDHIQYFTCWCIWSYEEFQKIMQPGGIYEAALRLKEEGVVDHICCSLHARPEEMIKIIKSGAFEGATVSYSLLNALQMQPVLDAAWEQGVSIAVMNPLGGGLIAQNRDFFSFACGPDDQANAVHAALRFVHAHPAVDIVLSGANSKEELADSLAVFQSPDPEPPAERVARVLEKASGIEGFCSGCKYCEGCPQGIPTSAIMRARNTLLFDPVELYGREGPRELLYDLHLFHKLYLDLRWQPETPENPCVNCGQCERNCTQKLKIIDGVADTYRRAKRTGYSKQAHVERLRELLTGKGYRKAGIYPSGHFVDYVLNLYQDNLEEQELTWLLFNSDPKIWGTTTENGLTVHSPAEISELRPDVIIVASYRYEAEIVESLRQYEAQGIRIESLFRDGEIPWVY